MSVEALSRAGQQPDSVPIAESRGWSAPGVRVLVSGIVMLLAGVVLLALGVSLGPNAAGPIALIWAAAVLIIAGYLAVRGLTSVVAGEARVIQLFGRYRGTVRAVVGARTRIVEGAVGMVQLALRRLQEEDVVELDEERKAAMVSNLLVVLCSEQATQQVVNTGSLYQ